MNQHLWFVARASVVTLSLCGVCRAQTGFGVDGNFNLFSFDVTAPGSIPITPIGNLGFLPEGIDFKPGSNTLYGIDVGPITTQLYTINIGTGAATPTTASFPSVGAGYNLTGNQHFGFDFDPSSLDGGGNFQIRLVSTNGENLRINSGNGSLTANDTDLLIQPGSNAPFTDASAYINNVPNQATFATTLYNMDTRNDSLYTQSPQNAGTMTLVGAFGATINDAIVGIGFDVYTVPGDADPTTGGDSAYAVLKRTNTQSGAYLLYQVNLGTGAIFNGKLVGPAGTPSDFSGGFAIAPLPVPEPASFVMVALVVAGAAARRLRRR
jgi:hypothetical protein